MLPISRLMKSNNYNEDGITIQRNYNTLKSRIILAHSYQTDFTIKNGLRYISGFDAKCLGEDGVYDCDRQVNITDIHSVLISCSLVSSSYLNGSPNDVIYGFSPNKSPGFLLSIKPNNLIYGRMGKREEMSNITIHVTDQDGRPIDFNKERTTFLLHIKSM